jgi:hypothetical protein
LGKALGEIIMISNNPFSTATTDTLNFKQLICGRHADLLKIFQHLYKGESIALFGDRRIGKTLVLWLIRDIINGTIDEYRDSLWDEELRLWLTDPKTNPKEHGQAPSKCIYLSLHTLNRKSVDGILEELRKEFPFPTRKEKPKSLDGIIETLQQELLAPTNKKVESLVDLFKRVDYDRGRRLVILIDEMELLNSNFEDSTIVFRQLNAVRQSCSNISFIFSGAEHWRYAYLHGEPAISENCVQAFLSVPDCSSFKKSFGDNLIKYISFNETDKTSLTTQLIEETGGKPFFCQALADELARGKNFNDALNEVQRSYRPQIDNFFRGHPEPGPSILRLLAHENCTAKRVTDVLGTKREEVMSMLADFKFLGKIHCNSDGEYSLCGRLFETWGKNNLDPPKGLEIR